MPPSIRFLLLQDFRSRTSPEEAISDLRAQMAAVPEFATADLIRSGLSAVAVLVPAHRQREKDRLKNLLKETLRGWTVIEEQAYELPIVC